MRFLPYTLLSLLPLTTALYTPRGSSCAVQCGTKAQNFTGTGDLVCLDTAYTDTTKGQTYKSCVDCLGNSTYYNTTASYPSNSDQWWFLWHLKYIQEYCLVDTPQTSAASNCAGECDGLKDVLDTSWLYEGVQPQYGYCSWNGSEYKSYAGDCATCLKGQVGGVVIGNAMSTLLGACDSQPMVQSGGMVEVQGDLFATEVVTSTTSSATASRTSSATSTGTSSTSELAVTGTSSGSAAATTSAVAQSSGASSNNAESSGGLSAGAGAGIGIGIAIVVIAAIAGAVFLWLRRRKQRRGAQAIPDAPPRYLASELGDQSRRTELASGEKPAPKIVEVEARNGRFPMQELDATGSR